MAQTLGEIAQLIGGTCVGDSDVLIEGITNSESPQKGFIAFAQDEKTLKKLADSDLAALIVPDKVETFSKPIIQSAHPKLAWAKLLRAFFPAPTFSKTIADNASIASSAKIGKDVTIEAFARVSEGAVIEDGAVIRSFAFIGENVKIGSESIIHPHVMIYEDCQVGKSVIIHAGTVIGTDGFGYVATPEKQEKVPQVGNVIIEDEVEIGACVTIDRATVGSTVIGKDCKIDNLVQIAHNVTVGPHTAISAQTGISGSSKIGAHVTMGGKAGVGDHVEIGDWVMVGAGAGFPSGKKTPPKQIVFGQPARPYHEARKQIAAQLRSAEMYQEIKSLKNRLAELEKKLAEKENSVG